MIKRILLIFVLLMSISVGFSSLITNNEIYYSFNNDSLSGSNPLDLSVNSNDGTNTGATIGIPGILNESFGYDGSSSFISHADVTAGVSAFTISVWVNADSTAGGRPITSLFGASPSENSYLLRINSNALQAYVYTSSQVGGTTQNFTTTNDWVHVVMVYNGSEIATWVDGVKSGTTYSQTGTVQNGTATPTIGKYTSTYFDGEIDEFAIYSRALNQSEIDELYNNGAGYNPYLDIQNPLITINNITANNNELINNSFFMTNYINFELDLINTSTNGNINTTFSLYNSTNNLVKSQTINNTLNPNYNFTGLSEQEYKINIYSFNNETNVSSGNYTFTIDLTPPTINNSIPNEINSYSFLDSYFSCGDIGTGYCNISINGLNKASGTNFTLVNNGNLSYIITASDSANNTVTDLGVVLVNPPVYFSFNNSGSLLQNFTLGGVEFNNTEYVGLNIYDSIIGGLGNKSLEWSKLGFITQNISFEVTNTSNINNSYNISLANIIINIYDKNTLNLITGVNFSLEFIATIGVVASTTTGTKTISNLLFLNEQYTVIVSSSGYKTETVFFDYNNKENKTISVYMINSTQSNLGFVQINVLSNVGQAISGAIVQALQWDSSTSSYFKVSESKTSEDGIGLLNIILDDKYYIFSAYTTTTNIINSTAQIIATSQNGKSIFLTLQDFAAEEQGLLQGLTTNITEIFNNVTNVSTVTFNWINSYGNTVNPCINIYRLGVTGEKSLLSENCASPSSSGSLIKSSYINSTYDILISAEIKLNEGGYITIKSFLYYSSISLPNLILEFGLQYFVLMIIFIIGIFIIVDHSVQIGSIFLMIGSGLGMYLIPSILRKSVMAFIIFICLAIIIGSIRGDR